MLVEIRVCALSSFEAPGEQTTRLGPDPHFAGAWYQAFTALDKTRTRGKSALVFAAHPERSLLAYGDNYGDFYLHEFAAEGFGKARKVGPLERPARAVGFITGGKALLIVNHGMHGVSVYSYDAGSLSRVGEFKLPFPVNQIVVSPDARHIGATAQGAPQIAFLDASGEVG
jgi:hypothetical protein